MVDYGRTIVQWTTICLSINTDNDCLQRKLDLYYGKKSITSVQFYKSRIIFWQLLPWLLWGVWTMENEGRKRSTSPHRGRRTICLYLLNLGAPPGGWGGWLDNQKYFQVLWGACYFNPTNWEREKVLHSTAVFWLLLKVESIQILWKSRQKTFSKDIYLNSVLYWQEYSLFCKILNSINSHKLQVDGLWIRLQTKCKRLLTRDCWTNKSCCWLWQEAATYCWAKNCRREMSTWFLFRCMCVKNKLITCDDIFKFSLRKKVETRVKSQKVEQPEESRPNRRCLEQITVLRRINKVWFWAIEGGAWLTSDIFQLSLMKHIW